MSRPKKTSTSPPIDQESKYAAFWRATLAGAIGTVMAAGVLWISSHAYEKLYPPIDVQCPDVKPTLRQLRPLKPT